MLDSDRATRMEPNMDPMANSRAALVLDGEGSLVETVQCFQWQLLCLPPERNFLMAIARSRIPRRSGRAKDCAVAHRSRDVIHRRVTSAPGGW